MLYTLSVDHHFEAAHYLPNHPGKCQYLHGHRWEVRVTIATELDPRQLNGVDGPGMILDFGIIKELIDELDHGTTNLNMRFPSPTAEVIATHIHDQVCAQLQPGYYQVVVQLWESPECSVTVQGIVQPEE